ncbi:hypothetical protein CEXT_102261 [Caerostris extrusa]|uniref:Uncharacterized protein n=1 Tax=Caerostris extrusa TaxID=172846 RepID=A0AAV4TDU0_CAEEX|nr:hypothetical protein CEXT_102261 [Caerostris extrusa]
MHMICGREIILRISTSTEALMWIAVIPLIYVEPPAENGKWTVTCASVIVGDTRKINSKSDWWAFDWLKGLVTGLLLLKALTPSLTFCPYTALVPVHDVINQKLCEMRPAVKYMDSTFLWVSPPIFLVSYYTYRADFSSALFLVFCSSAQHTRLWEMRPPVKYGQHFLWVSPPIFLVSYYTYRADFFLPYFLFFCSSAQHTMGKERKSGIFIAVSNRYYSVLYLFCRGF